VRIALFVMLGLNVIYLAWAGWIDAPPAPPIVNTANPNSSLRSLTLLSERSAGEIAQLTQPRTSGTADTQSLPAVVEASPTSTGRCVSVGPFNDLTRAARGAALLRERGFTTRQRAEQGDTWEGYWVFVGGLQSAADENKLISTLTRAGISDAHAMPQTDSGRRVSVGLFSERARAEKRAQAVKKLGFTAQVTERKQPGTVYWVDLELGANDRTVPTEGLLSLEDAGSRLEIRVCPASAPASPAPSRPQLSPRDARPAATTADAGLQRPG
jgi:cell division septation protein DedD